jgi:hypothetical protein
MRPHIRLLLVTLSDVSFVPALRLTAQRRRHFETWVSLLQVIANFAYNACVLLGTSFLIPLDDWHRIADIMNETLIMLIMLHLCGLEDEDLNAALRYAAFTAAWLAKLADGWSTAMFELCVIAAYALAAAATMLCLTGRAPRYDTPSLARAAAAAGIGVGSFALAEALDESAFADWCAMPVCHAALGAATYYGWSALKVLDRKSDDDLPLPQWK